MERFVGGALRSGRTMAPVESDVVVVTHLFPLERAALVKLLTSQGDKQWQAPTVCPGWSVKDVALHLLGDDIGLLSRRRDGVATADAPSELAGWQQLVAFLDRLNQTWVEATRRISPRLLCELLAFTGEATWRYLASVDPLAVEGRVSWVGPGTVPNWLDVAREYTERWTHQQQIRDAVGMPGLKQPAFMAPVLATFVHALPRAFAGVPAPIGTTVEVMVGGQAGGCWVLTRTPDGWRLAVGTAADPVARVTLDAETAWRVWTKGIGQDAAQAAVAILGDRALGRRVLDAVAIIG
jgi:uncharacterized protein (TIGR03083 family)